MAVLLDNFVSATADAEQEARDIKISEAKLKMDSKSPLEPLLVKLIKGARGSRLIGPSLFLNTKTYSPPLSSFLFVRGKGK